MRKKHPLLKFAIITVATLGSLYFINKLIERSALSNRNLKSSPSDYYDWNGEKIYYNKKGNGSPLLLIHELSSNSSAFEWDRVRAKLAETHTVYTVDLPGCGRSSKTAVNYVNYYYVQFVQAFLKDIVKEKADICATGTSSLTALAAASVDSGLIGRLILVNPPSVSLAARELTFSEKLLKFIIELPVIGTFLYNIKNSRRLIDNELTQQKFYNPFNVTASIIDAYYEASHIGGGKGRFVLSSLLSGSLNIDIPYTLKRAGNEIEIISGTARPDYKKAEKSYTDLNPGIQTAYIDKACMLPQIEEPENFVCAVNDFLK